jgi:signal transduction histidine kinase
MLHEFITENRAELIARARAKARERRQTQWPMPTKLDAGMPNFLMQLAERLKPPFVTTERFRDSAARRGSEMMREGWTARHVVHDYGDICQAITEAATDHDASISTVEFRNLNQCLDDAIAEAVTEFGQQRERQLADEQADRLGELAEELRKYVTTASFAYETIAKGTVGIGGSTGASLGRSLLGLRRLIDRTLPGVHLDHAELAPRSLTLADVIDEVEIAGNHQARAVGIRFEVVGPDRAVEVEIDRSLLAAALDNMVRYALKFTPRRGLIVLRALVSAKSVAIEIEDQCGGLGAIERDAEPRTQHGEDGGELGLALTTSRQGIEAGGGMLTVRDLPSKGCVFALTLPRAPLLS